MAINSKIEWTGNTWNPVTGCTQISDGCLNCYAMKMAKRLKLMGNKKYANGFDVTTHEGCLNDPLAWKKPSMVFVNSMSDLYHENVPDDYIRKVFEVMNSSPQHTFQLLTKRPERLVSIANNLEWAANIWQGVTVENEKYVERIDLLKQTPAQTKFISFEPLLADVGVIDLSGIDWAIVGGESGPKSRPIELEWILSIKNQCEKQEVLFYFKQWGGMNKKKTGRELLGRTWDAIPKMSFVSN
jgi:protein gp37